MFATNTTIDNEQLSQKVVRIQKHLVNGPVPFKQSTPAAKTTTTTLTAAELLGGLITDQGAGAAVALTLPLATDLETALVALYPDLANDDAFEFSLINLSTNALDVITVTTNTGWTLVGKMTLEANSAVTADARGNYWVRRTAANAYTLYRVA